MGEIHEVKEWIVTSDSNGEHTVGKLAYVEGALGFTQVCSHRISADLMLRIADKIREIRGDE